jgi:hypothetical protein
MTSPPRQDPAEPPEDPEAWTDEQWLAWLDATDADERPGGGNGPRPKPRRTGNALGVAMLGLRDAIYGRPDDEVAIVNEAPGEPPNDELHEIRLDPDHPERSEVVVRRRPPTPD